MILRIAELQLKRRWKEMVIERARQSALPQNHSGEYKAKVHIMKNIFNKKLLKCKIICIKHHTCRVSPLLKTFITFSWRRFVCFKFLGWTLKFQLYQLLELNFIINVFKFHLQNVYLCSEKAFATKSYF